jgi:hypothetical protein
MFTSSGTLSRLAGLSAIAAMQAAASSAGIVQTQTVIIPAPPRAETRPEWNCRFQQPVGATRIHASRLLDATGAYVSDSAGWTDVDTANPRAPLTISVAWGSRDGRSHFADGMTTFFFRADRAISAPRTVQLGGPEGPEIAAGQAYINPREFVAYAPIGRVVGVIGGGTELRWALRGMIANGGAERTSLDGAYAATMLLQLKSGYEQAITQIDLMQADFSKRCTRMR